MTLPVVGTAVPSFTAATNHGDVSLASLKGKQVVLYFYPKDNTPGCTTQAQDFRDLYSEFTDAGCEILGVSRDSIKSHEGFAEKQQIPYPLIADTDEALCELFGVIKMKNMYGKQVRGIERSTFLIDANGILTQEWRGVRADGHAKELLDVVTQAKSGQ